MFARTLEAKKECLVGIKFSGETFASKQEANVIILLSCTILAFTTCLCDEITMEMTKMTAVH